MPNPIDLADPIYNDDEAARAYIEARRWPDGPYCPRCGECERVTKLKGKSTRPGLYACAACRQHFTVTVGTIYERSHLPLHKWVLASHLMAASKKGISAHQLHRLLGLPYKTAWFMAHRIRAARDGAADDPGGLGGEGKTVEADETYFGNKDVVTKRTKRGKPSLSNKRAVVGLVERGGKARTFHVERADGDTVKELLRQNAGRKSRLMTDESRLYTEVGAEYAGHGTVNHTSGEYVGFDDPEKHTQTIDGYFGLFKRGMKGNYQHCGEQHLHRYLAEFEFRYNSRIALGMDDKQRAKLAIAGMRGKRLTYR